jgi:four helix bundle protein
MKDFRNLMVWKKSHQLTIAMGSASELDYHLILAHDLGYLQDPVYRPLAEQTQEVKRMLAGLIKRLTANR